ncbi:membrane or secreted protein [Beggiatoa sp. PS]|nr:membrane or secreted protein [Beggiatoa sp. PS]
MNMTKTPYSGLGLLFVLLLPLVLLLGGCEDAGIPAELAELHRIASSEGMDEAWDYLDSLPSPVRIEVARFIANDIANDPDISPLGIQALVESGHLDDAVPPLSAKVSNGNDLTAFGYAWSHDDDPQLVTRMYLKICRYQLARLDSFEATQRKNVERFLSNGGHINRLTEFSPEAAAQRLLQIEASLLESGDER